MPFRPLPNPAETLAISRVIASRGATDIFEDVHIVPDPEGASRVSAVSYNLLYMIPGVLDPRLHKRVHLPNDFSREDREEATRVCLEPTQRLLHVGNNIARLNAEQTLAACEDMEAREDTRDAPYRPLGLLAIYQTDIRKPFAMAYSDRVFVDTLAEHVELAPPVGDMPDEALREVYALQTEHNDLPPYDIWKEGMATLLDEKTSDEIRRRDIAMGLIHSLLQPRDATHPVINALLF
jgi:hypothetical protein